MVGPDLSFHGLARQNVHEREDFLKMDLIENDICIKCNKGGKVFVCSDSVCSISVHEKCMGCPPRFDNSGNYYCPYCIYRQSNVETCALRERALFAEKALSRYIDNEKPNPEQHKQKSTVVGEIRRGDSEITITSNNIQNQSVQLEEKQKGISVFCATNTLPSIEIDTLILNKEDDVCRDIGKLNHFDHQGMIVDHKLVVAYGDDGEFRSKEGTSHEFERIEMGKIVEAENHKKVDDLQFDRVLEDQQQVGHSRASIVEGETTLSSPPKILGKGNWQNADTRKQVQEITSSLPISEPSPLVESESNRDLATIGSIIRDTETVAILRRHLKDKDKQLAQPQNIDLPRRSTEMLPLQLVTYEVKGDKNITCNKSGQLEDPYKQLPNLPCHSGKRIKWSREEEEMLKAGVEKFSLVVNKNIPWKKILDLGREVFPMNRTPSELKDKWRKMVKERSTK